MIAMICFNSLNSEQLYAQLDKEELGKLFACSFKDKPERMHCVTEPVGSR